MKGTLKLALVLVVAVAAAGAWYAWQSRGGEGEVRYRLAKVERGPIAAVVAASGTLNAVTTVQVGSQISGQVTEIHADFNTPVKKGQVIARIDAASYELRVNQAHADLDAAESALAAARSGLAAHEAELGHAKLQMLDAERDKERTALNTMREQVKAVQAQIRASEAQVRTALAAVKHREMLLRQAQVDLERTIIRAPVDGTVILRNVDAGQTVAASGQAPVLFTIAQDLRDMQIEAVIDEVDVGRLRVGMPASFFVDAFPRLAFTGEVRQIRKSPSRVVISAPNPELTLLPGMTANARIVVEERAAALKVPNAALRFRMPGTELADDPVQKGRARAAAARLWVLKNGRPAPVEVRLGISDGASTEIADGPVAEGAMVVVGLGPGAGGPKAR